MEPAMAVHDPYPRHQIPAAPSAAVEPPISADDKAQAVVDLIGDGILSHTCGEQQEYEVRTTIERRQGWGYGCRVFFRRREIPQTFPSIVTELTPAMRTAPMIPGKVLETLATDAVEVHVTRLAAVAEYALLASIFTPPRRRGIHWWLAAGIVLFGAACLVAYSLWHYPAVGGRLSPSTNEPALMSEERPWGSASIPQTVPAEDPVVVIPAPAGEKASPQAVPPASTLGTGHSQRPAQDETALPLVRAGRGEREERAWRLPSASLSPSQARQADCLLKILKGEPC
jgi:hypothetical protein